ncbi:MAG: hypothetical protein LIP16_12555 [Clostridium sp.]|nr:hypothetical protein [Clostridium sp.]
MGDGSTAVNRETGKKVEQHEALYFFVRESLLALQTTGGYGENNFTCPLCGGKAHVTRKREGLYSTGTIECRCGYSFRY